MSMEIFFPGSDTSPDMSLLLVYIQYLANFYGQSRIDHFQAFYAILMYRTLRNPEFLCCLPHRRPIFHDIIGNLDSPLFDICFQKTTPCILVVSLYAGGVGFMYEKSQSFSHRSQII